MSRNGREVVRRVLPHQPRVISIDLPPREGRRVGPSGGVKLGVPRGKWSVRALCGERCGRHPRASKGHYHRPLDLIGTYRVALGAVAV